MGGARCEPGGSSDGPGPGPRRPPWPPASACRPAPGSRVRGSLGYARLSRAHPLPFALRCGAGLRASAGQGHRADVQPPDRVTVAFGNSLCRGCPHINQEQWQQQDGSEPQGVREGRLRHRGAYRSPGTEGLTPARQSHGHGGRVLSRYACFTVSGQKQQKWQQLQKSPSPPTLRRRAASAGWGLPCISETGGGGCPCPASVVPELRGRAGASWGLQARAGWGSSREAPESPWVAAFLATEMHIFGVT